MSKHLFDKMRTVLRKELKSELSLPVLPYADSLHELHAILNYSERCDISGRDFAILTQLNDVGKKFIGKTENSVSKDIRDANAWSLFLEANTKCKTQNGKVKNNEISYLTDQVLQLAYKDIERCFWHVLESEESPFVWGKTDCLIPVKGFSTGPGSCCNSEGVSVLEKYSQVWRTSTEIGKRYLQVLRKISKPIHDLPNFAVELSALVKAFFADKRYDVSRMIVPQNNGDLLLQYPAGNCLEQMLKCMLIDIAGQQAVNRDLARRGSLHDNLDLFDHGLNRRKWRPCTIDLSSASDIVGYELVKSLCPTPLFNYMWMCRAGVLSYEKKKTGLAVEENVSLESMATMGNGYCFPLQTVVFASIVRAVYFQLGIPLVDKDGCATYSVYGDDIIVDVTAYEYVLATLIDLEMVPNKKKSFGRLLFRESCGGDFYNGYNVRPVHVEKLDSDDKIYSFVNRLLIWSAEHSVCVRKTVTLLLKCIKVKCVVPMHFGVHAGLRVTSDYLPFLPMDWREGVGSKVLRDCRKEMVYSRLWYSPYWKCTKPKYITNVYSSYLTRAYVSEGIDKPVNVNTGESLFCFLRGGFSFVRNNWSYCLVTSGKSRASVATVTIPDSWDDLYYEDNATTVFNTERYNGNLMNVYTYVLKRNLDFETDLASHS